MKAQIHPKWFDQAQVTCVCGNTFTTGATLPQIQVDVCYNCHPFYTGQMKYVDTAGRVDAFRTRMQKVQDKVLSKTEKRKLKTQKRLESEFARPTTLAELRQNGKKNKK